EGLNDKRAVVRLLPEPVLQDRLDGVRAELAQRLDGGGGDGGPRVVEQLDQDGDRGLRGRANLLQGVDRLEALVEIGFAQELDQPGNGRLGLFRTDVHEDQRGLEADGGVAVVQGVTQGGYARTQIRGTNVPEDASRSEAEFCLVVAQQFHERRDRALQL